jgi:hypothetical protein
MIVGHEELAVEVEHSERQIIALDLQHGSGLDVGSVT